MARPKGVKDSKPRKVRSDKKWASKEESGPVPPVLPPIPPGTKMPPLHGKVPAHKTPAGRAILDAIGEGKRPSKPKKPLYDNVPTHQYIRWTEEVEDAILYHISSGMTVREAMAVVPNAPTVNVFYVRLVSDSTFFQRYQMAQTIRADKIADEILTIADDSRNDWMERHGKEDAGWLLNGDHVRRAALRIEARKWYLGKLLPARYGESNVSRGANVPGAVNQPGNAANVDPVDRSAIVAKLQQLREARQPVFGGPVEASYTEVSK